MSIINEIALVPAAWDLNGFLNSAKTYAQTAGGALLMLMGTVGLIWGGVLLLKKLMAPANSGNQTGWGVIIALILVGGAIGVGGFTLISKVGSGGQQTITDLGGGTVIQTYGE